MIAFHPTRDRQGRWQGFREEAYAADPRLPEQFSDRSRVVHASAGTVLFLPRAYWHETRSVGDTFGLNLVIKGVSWAGALAAALLEVLHREPRFRAYCEGVAHRGRSLSPSEQARGEETFERLRAAAAAALADMTMDDVVLSSLVDRVYQWSPKAAGRALVQEDGQWTLRAPEVLEEPLELDESVVAAMEKLCALREPFSWAHARCLLSGIGSVGLCNLLTELVEMGLLVRPDA